MFLLCEKKILTKPVLYISNFFVQNRAEYYDRLQAVRDSGDWEGWLAFFLRGVESVGNEAATTVRWILELREAHRAAAANALAARLAAVGVLKELTGQKRNRLFAYRQYIRIFEADPE